MTSNRQSSCLDLPSAVLLHFRTLLLFRVTSASEHSQNTPRFLKTLLRVALCLYTLYSDKSRTMQTKSSQTSPVPNSTLDSRLMGQTRKCLIHLEALSQSDCYTQDRPSRALHTTASLSCPRSSGGFPLHSETPKFGLQAGQ